MKRLLLILPMLMVLSACSHPSMDRQEALIHQNEVKIQKILRGLRLHPNHPTTPRRLTLPRERARVLPLKLSGSELIPPSDPQTLGWWGRKAGAPHGTTLLVGHTVHHAAWKIYGKGVLNDLETIPVGSVLDLSRVKYEVTSNKVISKKALARRAPRLFSQTGPPRLVVVTCEGYNRATGHYSNNVVLVATPLEAS